MSFSYSLALVAMACLIFMQCRITVIVGALKIYLYNYFENISEILK